MGSGSSLSKLQSVFGAFVALRGTGPRATVAWRVIGGNRFLGYSLHREGQALALRYRGGLLGVENRFLVRSLHREGQALALR